MSEELLTETRRLYNLLLSGTLTSEEERDTLTILLVIARHLKQLKGRND